MNGPRHYPLFLPRDLASAYLWERWGIRRSAPTLAKLACLGGGPAFRKDGRKPLYPRDGLDAWAREKLGLPADGTGDPR